jgi:putative transposase
VRGPIIDGRQTVLYAIIDDHSRYIMHGRWGFAEDVAGLLALLHDAVAVHGCPVGFYCDHGGAFLSGQLAWTLAVLGIRIIHSRKRRPQGRGKIEKWTKTCREEFLVEVETGAGTGGTRVSSLAELNRLFHAWLHHSYHQRVHSETKQNPAQRYHHREDDTPTPHRPGTDQLWRAFRWHKRRKVTKWRTVSLFGNSYEVASSLVGEKVDLLFNPLDLTRIDVELRGQPKGQAHPHTITRHVHPDLKPPATAPATAPAPATGIDYLRLLEAAHQTTVGTTINFAALAAPGVGGPDAATGGDPGSSDATTTIVIDEPAG